MRVLRASYTVLNAWDRGDYEQAINSLFRLKELDTPQIRAGREYDEAWTKEIKQTGKLPEVFGAKALKKPQTQLYLRAQLAPWLIFSGKLDGYDEGTVIEFKTGVSEAQTIIESPQPGGYAILCHFNNLPADKIEVYCHNQYQNKNTFAFAWVNDALIKKTSDWIEGNASELYDYLEKNNLWELGEKNADV